MGDRLREGAAPKSINEEVRFLLKMLGDPGEIVRARLRKENFHLGKSSDEQGELIDRLTTKAPGTMVTLPSLDVRHVSAAMRQIFYNYFPYEPVKFDPNLEEFNELRRRVSNSVIRCTNNDGDKFCRVPVSCFLDWLEGFEPVATLNHEAKAPMSLHEEG